MYKQYNKARCVNKILFGGGKSEIISWLFQQELTTKEHHIEWWPTKPNITFFATAENVNSYSSRDYATLKNKNYFYSLNADLFYFM